MAFICQRSFRLLFYARIHQVVNHGVSLAPGPSTSSCVIMSLAEGSSSSSLSRLSVRPSMVTPLVRTICDKIYLHALKPNSRNAMRAEVEREPDFLPLVLTLQSICQRDQNVKTRGDDIFPRGCTRKHPPDSATKHTRARLTLVET